VPYDVPSRVAVLQARHAKARQAAPAVPAQADLPAEVPAAVRPEDLGTTAQELSRESTIATTHDPVPQSANGKSRGIAAIGTVTSGKVTVEGKIRVVEIRPVERNSVLAVEINDSTGTLTAMFYGRSHIPGLICGARVRFTGSARVRGGQPVMINPAYELVSPGEE
jgi:RecG-like helicase